jgi:NitT/TauT family transport system substrate-binding protein
MMAAYVGLDPKKDFTLVDDPAAKSVELFTEGKLDAYLAFPPDVQELHARKVRPCGPEDRRGPAVVTVFLLHAGGEPGVCRTISGGDEARDPRGLKAADLCAGEP